MIKKGGRFQISADSDGVRHKQFYWPSTNVLVTRFLLADGIAELEDFMPVGLPSDSPEYRHVYRRIRCVRGTVRISVTCRPAFDYGRQTHATRIEANGATFKSGSLTLALSTAVPLRNDGRGGVSAEFVLSEGKSQVFALRDDCDERAVPCPPSEKRRRGVAARHCEILAGLALRLYLPRALAGSGAQISLGAEASYFSTYRRDHCSANHEFA